MAKLKVGKEKTPKTLDAYIALMTVNWGCAIFDEVQKCKNASSIVTRAVAMLSCQYRLGLSGTPIMNNGKEMVRRWSACYAYARDYVAYDLLG